MNILIKKQITVFVDQILREQIVFKNSHVTNRKNYYFSIMQALGLQLGCKMTDHMSYKSMIAWVNIFKSDRSKINLCHIRTSFLFLLISYFK